MTSEHYYYCHFCLRELGMSDIRRHFYYWSDRLRWIRNPAFPIVVVLHTSNSSIRFAAADAIVVSPARGDVKYYVFLTNLKPS